MAELIIGSAEIEEIVDDLKKHSVSKQFELNYDLLTKPLEGLIIPGDGFYVNVPEAPQRCEDIKTKFQKSFLIRQIVRREDIEHKHLGALRNAIAQVIHNRNAGYSSQAILQDLIDEMNHKKSYLQTSDLEERPFGVSSSQRLIESIVYSPATIFAIAKYEERFPGEGGYRYKKVQPVILVPGTQDRGILNNFETRHTKYIPMKGNKHFKAIDSAKYRELQKKYLPEED
jgi:hypothetical protein